MILTQRDKICIVGAGGFAKEVFCCIEDILKARNIKAAEVCCFMVKDQDFKEGSILGVKTIPESDFDPEVFETVVAVGDPVLRKKIVEKLPSNTVYPSLIHPTAVVSKYLDIAEGVIMAAGVIVTCDIKIGKHTVIDRQATVGHDSFIGGFCHIAPGAVVSGNVCLGSLSYIGARASIKEGCTLSERIIVGMGAVVVKNIEESGVYVGSPAKKIR